MFSLQTPSSTCRQRARTTIEDFTRSYFPYHGLDPLEVYCLRTRWALFSGSTTHRCGLQGLLQYIDVLVFVEATIYQMDEENEDLTSTGAAEDIVSALQGRSSLATSHRSLWPSAVLVDQTQARVCFGLCYERKGCWTTECSNNFCWHV